MRTTSGFPYSLQMVLTTRLTSLSDRETTGFLKFGKNESTVGIFSEGESAENDSGYSSNRAVE